MPTAPRAAPVLPPDARAREAPPPHELLARFRLAPRTRQVLRQYVARGRSDGGRWTVGRLLEIPGFGPSALADVLASLQARGALERPAPRAHTLEGELADLLARRRGRPGGTPMVDRALALVAARLPASEAEIGRRLVAARLLRAPIDLAQLERAARWSEVPPAFAVLRREGLVLAVPPEQLAFASVVHGLAVRAVVSWGLALVDRVAFQAGTEDRALVTDIVSAKENFRWLDRRIGWFWFESADSVLVRAVEKALAVAPVVPLSDLAQALFRRWVPENVPSRRALRELCAQVPRFRVRGGAVSLTAAPRPELLDDSERALVAMLRQHGPALDGHRVTSLAAGLGLPPGVLGRLLRASPFVLEPRPGSFRLVGAV